MVKYGLEKLVIAITFNMLKNLISTFKVYGSRHTDLENKLMVTRWRDRLGVWD